MRSEDIRPQIKETILLAAESLYSIASNLDASINEVFDVLLTCKGKIVVTGQGKSGIIGQKFVATLNSISIVSVFINAAEALHGDVGLVKDDDVVLFLSKSGISSELELLQDLVKKKGAKSLYIGSNRSTPLIKKCDASFVFEDVKEADDFGIIPTNSTISQMAICDALVIALMKRNSFQIEEFGNNHPNGKIGKIDFGCVHDFVDINIKPQVYINDSLKKVINVISSNSKGVAVVLDDDNNMIGVITDGDLRRMLEVIDSLTDIAAKDIMSKNPKFVCKDELARNAFELMKSNQITQLIVTEDHSFYGIVHLHDLIKNGF